MPLIDLKSRELQIFIGNSPGAQISLFREKLGSLLVTAVHLAGFSLGAKRISSTRASVAMRFRVVVERRRNGQS